MDKLITEHDLYFFFPLAPRPEFVWQAHDGPMNTLTRSPFFRDIILTVGGWTFAIWKEGVTVSFRSHSRP